VIKFSFNKKKEYFVQCQTDKKYKSDRDEIYSTFFLLFTAPNAYTLAKITDTPVYSLASRLKDPKRYVTPAPGAYEIADTNQYKAKAPAFSLSTRYTVPSDTSAKPGPGAYTPEKVNGN